MEKPRDIHIGVPYYLEFESDQEELQLDADTTMVCIYIPTQNKRYLANVTNKPDEPGVVVAGWSADDTSNMAPTTIVLEVYKTQGEEIVDILYRKESFAGIKRVSVSPGVKQ